MKTMMEDPPTRILMPWDEGYVVVPKDRRPDTRWERFVAWIGRLCR